ncbi:helix-turn-helix domain-containing protein [Rhizobium sp. CFBP 13644]|uniref:helix-turn-helix domain-containing protein n=1 Tax=unclassified Rhizobium TaxID=2613769 RepID=UPI00406CB794
MPVRRAFHVQGWSVKKIAKELNVSRNTVRKILRSDATDFAYKREHQPLPGWELGRVMSSGF